MSTKTTTDIMETMGTWFDKAPALPKTWRENLVKAIPVLTLIFGILGIILSISGLGIFTAASPFAYFGGATPLYYGNGFLTMLLYLIGYVLMLAAYPGTKGRKIKGWKLLFWSEAIFFVGGLISLSIVSAIIGALIGFYLLFQIRSYYK